MNENNENPVPHNESFWEFVKSIMTRRNRRIILQSIPVIALVTFLATIAKGLLPEFEPIFRTLALGTCILYFLWLLDRTLES